MQRQSRITTGLFALALLLLAASPACAAPSSLQTSPSVAQPGLQNLPPEARGDLCMARGEYIQAIQAYREAPRTAEIWDKMGVAWHHMEALGQARHDYEQALLIRPNYPEAINNLGATYYARHNYKKAIRFYRHALRLLPRSGVIAANLGTAYFAQGKFRKGFTAYRRAFENDPSVFGDPNSLSLIPAETSRAIRAHADYCLAELFAQAGMQKEALQYLTRALNEGYDKQEVLDNTVFAGLRKNQEFAQLVGETP